VFTRVLHCPYLSKINFNIIHPLTSRSSYWSISVTWSL
jgi:hypothetical protein